MRLDVVGIVELVRPDGVRQAGRQIAGHVVVVLRIGVGSLGNERHLGAHQPGQRNLLRTHGVRDDAVAPVTPLGGQIGEPDAGVPGRALDDRAARPELAAPLRRHDDAARGTVLDGAGGIEELALPVDARPGPRRDGPELDERRAANQVESIADPRAGTHVVLLRGTVLRRPSRSARRRAAGAPAQRVGPLDCPPARSPPPVSHTAAAACRRRGQALAPRPGGSRPASSSSPCSPARHPPGADRTPMSISSLQ